MKSEKVLANRATIRTAKAERRVAKAEAKLAKAEAKVEARRAKLAAAKKLYEVAMAEAQQLGVYHREAAAV